MFDTVIEITIKTVAIQTDTTTGDMRSEGTRKKEKFLSQFLVINTFLFQSLSHHTHHVS